MNHNFENEISKRKTTIRQQLIGESELVYTGMV